MPIIEALFLLSLIAPPSPAWEEWTKVILSVTIPLLIVSGGLFGVAWKVFRSGKSVYTTLAVEDRRTDEFDKAVRDIVRDHCLGPEFKAVVNDIRVDAEWRFKELMRTMIKTHDDEPMPHGNWRHDALTAILTAIEARLWKLERGQPPERER